MRGMMRLAALGAVLTIGAGTDGALAQMTFSSMAPPNHPLNKQVFEPWAEQIAKATGGRVNIRLLAKPAAAPNQVYDAIASGQADVAFAPHSYQPDRFLPYLVAELPFLGDKAEHTSVAYWRVHKALLEKTGIHDKVVLLGLMTHGPGMFHHARKPMLAPEDLRGQKMRVGGDIPAAMVAHFHGVPITQPAPKSYEILSQGIADGILFPLESVTGFNLTRVVPHTTYVKGGIYNLGFWVAMNKAAFEKLSAEDRQAIWKLSGESFARFAGAAWDRFDARALEAIRANKNTYQEVSPALAAELRKLTTKFEADYVAKMAKFGVDGRAVIDAFRGEIAKLATSN